MSETARNTPETQPIADPEPRQAQAVLPSTRSTAAYNPHLLRYLRETATLTPEALAEEIKVKPETVLNWETGRRSPNQKHQLALEKFFRLPSGWLMLETKDILAQDYAAAYLGNAEARERLEWADKHLGLGQALGVIPTLPQT